MQRIIKAEMWDKMQYLFRKYYDGMLHFALYYRGDINIGHFKKAVCDMLDSVPVLRSTYRNNFIKPFWVKNDEYDIDEIVECVEEYDYESVLNEFLTKSISPKSTTQIMFLIVKSRKVTALGILANHMCFDGGELKKIISTLIANYNAYLGYGKSVEYRSGRRDYRLVYEKFNDEDRKKAKKLYKNISSVKAKKKFPLTRPTAKDKCKINKIKLEAELVGAFKEAGKKYGATLNDLYLTAFFYTLYEMYYEVDTPLTIPCMVNLRRHIPFDGEREGYANHTGFMTCSVLGKGRDFCDMLAEVKKSTEESKNDKFLGLYGLPLLNLGYAIFPHFLSEAVIRIGYENPLIGMSNVGIISEKDFELAETELMGAFITGGIKYKPFMQLAVSSCKGVSTITIAEKCNRKDEELINNFLIRLKKTIYDFVQNN